MTHCCNLSSGVALWFEGLFGELAIQIVCQPSLLALGKMECPTGVLLFYSAITTILCSQGYSMFCLRDNAFKRPQLFDLRVGHHVSLAGFCLSFIACMCLTETLI